MGDPDLDIVVPSKGRAANMPALLRLLPTATVCVDASEAADYAPHVPAAQLRTHGPIRCFGDLWQAIIDGSPCRCVVKVDDDLRCVWSHVGRRARKIDDPGAIVRIIENAAVVASDLCLSLFTFSQRGNPTMFDACDPFGLTGPACGIFGIIGRRYAFDRDTNVAEDLDLTLNVLKGDRVLFQDRRFKFDFGQIEKGVGGGQTLRTSERYKRDSARIKARWGRYIAFEGKDGQPMMSVRVPRKSDLATR